MTCTLSDRLQNWLGLDCQFWTLEKNKNYQVIYKIKVKKSGLTSSVSMTLGENEYCWFPSRIPGIRSSKTKQENYDIIVT